MMVWYCGMVVLWYGGMVVLWYGGGRMILLYLLYLNCNVQKALMLMIKIFSQVGVTVGIILATNQNKVLQK